MDEAKESENVVITLISKSKTSIYYYTEQIEYI